MWLVVRHGKGQCFLAIAESADADPQRLTHRRGAAIGTDHKAGCNLGAVGQGDQRRCVAGQHPRKSDTGAKADIGQVRQTGHHLAPQKPVGQVPAKGRVGNVGGVKLSGQAGHGFGTTGVDDPHHLQGGCMRGKPVPEPCTGHDRDAGLQYGRRAQIRTLGFGFGDRGAWVDADHAKPMCAKGAGSGQTRNPATRYQDFRRFTHFATLGKPYVGRAARPMGQVVPSAVRAKHVRATSP